MVPVIWVGVVRGILWHTSIIAIGHTPIRVHRGRVNSISCTVIMTCFPTLHSPNRRTWHGNSGNWWCYNTKLVWLSYTRSTTAAKRNGGKLFVAILSVLELRIWGSKWGCQIRGWYYKPSDWNTYLRLKKEDHTTGNYEVPIQHWMALKPARKLKWGCSRYCLADVQAYNNDSIRALTKIFKKTWFKPGKAPAKGDHDHTKTPYGRWIIVVCLFKKNQRLKLFKSLHQRWLISSQTTNLAMLSTIWQRRSITKQVKEWICKTLLTRSFVKRFFQVWSMCSRMSQSFSSWMDPSLRRWRRS